MHTRLSSSFPAAFGENPGEAAETSARRPLFGPLRLRPKLVLSYVVLGVCITLISLVGGHAIQAESARRSSYRAALAERGADVTSIADSAAEEGFSFVLIGDPGEARRSLSKLAQATTALRDLSDETELGVEERQLVKAGIVALATERAATEAFFESFARTGVMTRATYDAYESAIDDRSAKLVAFRTFLRNQNEREAELATRRLTWMTILVGLLAVLVAVGLGSGLAHYMTRSLLALRNTVAAFGLGRQSVAVSPSDDEIGDLATAFRKMTSDIDRQVTTIRDGQQLLQDVFASIEDIVVVCDDHDRILIANLACCRASGYSAEEILGKPVATLFGLDAPGQRSSTTPEPALAREHDATLRTADGRDVAVRLSVSRFQGQGGRGWVCAAQNMTDKHRLEAELRQAQKMEGIGRLAGGVAHDFNNLLSVILAYSEMLTDGLDEHDPMRRDLEDIHEAGERAAGLTRQLLAFSRQQVLQPQIVHLNDTVAGMEKMLRRLIGEDVVLTTISAPNLAAVNVDPGQMEQVLMNLALNARDAMPSGGRLTIETRDVSVDRANAAEHPGVTPGLYAMLAVTDTGTGMDAAMQRHVFEPFFTTKTLGKGTGLGLSTVFGIVQQSGGHVSVRSAVGEGTTFRVLVPAAAPPLTLTERPPEATEVDAFRGSETVLLVEDEEGVRRLAHTILRRHGYTVLEAQNGGEALLICEQYKRTIDLVLTDVVMPHLNGRELFERLHILRPEMRVLYMSGYIDHAFDDDRVGPGAGFLQKPITPAMLARRVRQVIDSARA